MTNCTIPDSILSNAGASHCNVTWSGTGAASYLIQYKKVSELNWQTSTSATNSVLLNGLSANTNYEVRIQSVCGATSSAFSNTVNFTTLTNTSTCSHPAWNPSTVYLNGDTVSHNNIIYKAKYWTQNNIPSSNYGNCCAWEYIMPCGGFTAATCYKPLWDGLIAYNSGNQVFWNGSVYVAQWWTLNQNPTSNSGAGAVWQVLSTNPCQVTLQVKSNIQGYYLAVNHNMTYADSLTIELRENIPASSFPLVGTCKHILSQNGMINCTYANTVFGKSCYLVLKHKNGLQTWSANPILIGASTTYDFSTSASQAYGNNQSEVESGVWAIYSGDINQDENIDLLDLGLLEIDINSFAFGYLDTDINGDGNVDLLDNPTVEANISAFVFSIHP
jgi:chitodextrinase